ncbi:hypothetical protein GUI12_04175 [Anaplasmataceae bacterium AB001_6]|nr:hypothetical protein GUI12_04175 [Anaplasmataceae bacterium AB001_6]
MDNHSIEDAKLKEELAWAYRIIAHLQMDDLTYTHLTVRSADRKSFFIARFDKLFSEVQSNDMLEISLNENELPPKGSFHYNLTGVVIHRSIYNKRPDINSVIHLHTIDAVAVSAQRNGLRFLSQFAMPFYNNIAYHDYGALATKEKVQGSKIAEDLGDKNNMLLRNHGSVTCGKTIYEALFFARFLDQACKVQNKCHNHEQWVEPSEEVIKKAKNDMLNFEKNLGYNDFQALRNKIQNNNYSSSLRLASETVLS